MRIGLNWSEDWIGLDWIEDWIGLRIGLDWIIIYVYVTKSFKNCELNRGVEGSWIGYDSIGFDSIGFDWIRFDSLCTYTNLRFDFILGFILSSLEKTLLLVNLVTVPGSMFIVINFLELLHLITWVSIAFIWLHTVVYMLLRLNEYCNVKYATCTLRYHGRWILTKNAKNIFLLLKLRRLRYVFCKKNGKNSFFTF